VHGRLFECMTRNQYRKLVQDLFAQGLVGVRFFKEGMWWDVAIDTYLPCRLDFRPPIPLFARSEQKTKRKILFCLQQLFDRG